MCSNQFSLPFKVSGRKRISSKLSRLKVVNVEFWDFCWFWEEMMFLFD